MRQNRLEVPLEHRMSLTDGNEEAAVRDVDSTPVSISYCVLCSSGLRYRYG